MSQVHWNQGEGKFANSMTGRDLNGAPGATRTPDLWFRSSGSDVTRRRMEKAQVIRPTRNRWLQAGREVILTHTEKQALIWARMAGLRHKPRHTRSRRLFCPAIVPDHCPRGLRGGLLLALGCARPKKIFKKKFCCMCNIRFTPS